MLAYRKFIAQIWRSRRRARRLVQRLQSVCRPAPSLRPRPSLCSQVILLSAPWQSPRPPRDSALQGSPQSTLPCLATLGAILPSLLREIKLDARSPESASFFFIAAADRGCIQSIQSCCGVCHGTFIRCQTLLSFPAAKVPYILIHLQLAR